VSYSSTDRDWVRDEVLPRLERAGFRVCVDFRDFTLGAPIVTEIERALVSSRRALLVFTPAYLASDWSTFEAILGQTLDPAARQGLLLPIRLRDCAVPTHIRHLVYLDFTDDTDPDMRFARLIATIS
jgi:hypothetical protein